MKKRYELVIIGGGAAGLACAVSAIKSGCKNIAVIDRMSKVGKKLSVTGNGKCNLSSRNLSEEFYHGSFDVKPILDEYSDIRVFFEKLGLFTYSDSMGRIYPLSNTASSVADTLRLFNEKNGAEIITDTACTEIKRINNGFTVKTTIGETNAKALVLACGGCASSVHGSDGSGFSLAKELGIEVNSPYPALCPLYCENVKSLDGVRSKCSTTLLRNGQVIKQELGEVQFTKKGLSGICIFNLSAALENKDKNISVSLDLLPDFTFNNAYDMLLFAYKSRKEMPADEAFTGIFNKKIAVFLLKKANIPTANNCLKLDYGDLKRLANITKNLTFEITGRGDFSSAQVTAGGVRGNELDNNLMSKKVCGLFFAGEIIDIWGDCGGYNLHFAFASGIKAGRAAADYISGIASGNYSQKRNDL